MTSERRIKDNMMIGEMVLAICNGHPESINVCYLLLTNGRVIDPDDVGGGLSSVMMFDELGIYGERIAMFYNDVCDNHIGKMIAMFRAHQRGYAGVNTQTLNHSIDNLGAGINLDVVISAVTTWLPNFNLEAATLKRA